MSPPDTDPPADEVPPPFEQLTPKQWEAIETATEEGFFDRPQEATADEVAAELGLSRSTFLHHLRNAEREVFTRVCNCTDKGGD